MLWFLILTWVVQSGGVPISNSTNATLQEGLVDDMWTKGHMGESGETIAELLGVDGEIVEEGDVLANLDRNAVDTLWPGPSLPYEISPELMDREQNILKAFKMISDSTCIRFHKHANEFNYLFIVSGRGCASYVGCRGGKQSLYYSHYCSVGNLVHELMHALGLHHEHTRRDRDGYITINLGSVIRGRKKNFDVKHGDLQDLPYDAESIMHYGKYYFTIDRKPTITPRDQTVQIGQRSHLSSIDVQRLAKLYRCS